MNAIILTAVHKRSSYRITRHVLSFTHPQPNRQNHLGILNSFTTITHSNSPSPLLPKATAKAKAKAKAEARQQVLVWSAELTQHDHLYHNMGTPQITDAAYDTLRLSLQRLLTQHPELIPLRVLSDSVGAPPCPAVHT